MEIRKFWGRINDAFRNTEFDELKRFRAESKEFDKDIEQRLVPYENLQGVNGNQTQASQTEAHTPEYLPK